jgi:amino acid transporter
MRIVIQFIGQAVGLIILRKKNKTVLPFKMPLYPLPIILAILIWGFIFISTGKEFMLSGGIVIISGTIVYLIKSKKSKQWPFVQ